MKEALGAKFQLMIEPSLIERIDDWRFENRIPSRAKAVRCLVLTALDQKHEKSAASDATDPRHATDDL